MAANHRRDRSSTSSLGQKEHASTMNMNNYHSTRNLRKGDLGGVIFGAKNSTFSECLSKQLFGLPSAHFSYVRNIEPGLPLFLFNYNERKLHGIYEAAVSGQMNIDTYAWTDGGFEKTAFPAQVRVCINVQCQPLAENQFEKIISDNYYHQKLFWFELDHMQTASLIALFKSSPFHGTPERIHFSASKKASHLPEFLPMKPMKWRPVGSVGSSVGEAGPSDDPNVNTSLVVKEDPKIPASPFDERAASDADPGNVPCMDRENQRLVEGFDDGKEKILSKLINLAINRDGSTLSSESSMVRKEGDTAVAGQHSQYLEVSDVIKSLTLRTEALEKMQFESELKIEKLTNRIIELEEMLSFPESDRLFRQSLCAEKDIYIIGGYDGSSWISTLESYSPSADLLKPLASLNCTRANSSAIALGGRIYVLGGVTGDDLWFDRVDCYSPSEDKWTSCSPLVCAKGCLSGAVLDGKMFAIGGGNGRECFSDVEMFDPALGKWINQQQMQQKRFALAAAELQGAIYAVGGFDGPTTYLKSAERYDPRQPFWTPIPSMKCGRGSHSVAVLDEKLFAFGGHDGEQMVSSVEVFDPRLGQWMTSEPMSFIRGFSVAAVLGDSLLVFGGIKDKDTIVDAVECYKVGAGWTTIRSARAIGKRCFFSAVVL